MRLIDIDDLKLPPHFFERIDNVPKFYEWLEKQPTVDAVPVSFLEDLRNRAKTYEGELIIDEILSLWDAEQEGGHMIPIHIEKRAEDND